MEQAGDEAALVGRAFGEPADLLVPLQRLTTELPHFNERPEVGGGSIWLSVLNWVVAARLAYSPPCANMSSASTSCVTFLTRTGASCWSAAPASTSAAGVGAPAVCERSAMAQDISPS